MSFEFFSLETVQEIAREYGYGAVFLGILLENMGLPLPGETITLVGGFLSGSGELNYWLTLGSSIVGAVIGDNLGYWIGFAGGWGLVERVSRLFRVSETQLEEAKEQFRLNVGKAVLLGRFVTVLRIFAGPLAGIVRMPYSKFLLYNFIGATGWSFVMVTLAFFAGRVVPLEQVIAWVAQFALVAVILVVLWILVPILWEARKAKLQPPE